MFVSEEAEHLGGQESLRKRKHLFANAPSGRLVLLVPLNFDVFTGCRAN